jgi:methyltransferase (TIGR00027 family)
MKLDKVSRTAQYMALFRAIETNRNADDQLFSDPYAIYFLDGGLKLAAQASRFSFFRKLISNTIQRRIPGAFSSGLARTKYIDDLLQKTIKDGAQQVIILGAGFDTRVLRLDFLKAIPVIEIDHPNTSTFKMETFSKSIGDLPKNVTYYQIDFNKQSLDDLAQRNSVDFAKPTTLIWEGVTNYLTAEAIDKTFSFIALFPKDSYVIFTYVHKNVLSNPDSFLGGERLLNDLDKIEERWTFGFLPEQLSDFLKKFGLNLLEDSGATEYRNKYLPKRIEPGYEFYRVAMASRF